jgi:phosphoribosylglycinamide formyltransferase-1
VTARLVVLASGSGSNLAAIVTACESGVLDAQVVGVASDVTTSGALQRAGDAPTAVVDRRAFATREDFDHALADVVAAWAPNLVILAGFMRLLGATFLDRFTERVINLHPALPGDLPGLRAIERAHEESRTTGRTTTGAMVHFVPDEGMDDGPVILSRTVPIHPDDSLEALTARVRAVEHQLLVDAIGLVLAESTLEPPIYIGEQKP